MKELNTSINNDINKLLEFSNHINIDNDDKLYTTAKLFQQNIENKTVADDIKKDNIIYSDIDTILWICEKLKDELYLCLVSIKKDGKRKYEEQAKYLLGRIPIYHPTPEFIINQSDLSPEVIKELASLTDKQLDSLIKQVLEWIYESINKEYFLLSIHRHNLIKWRIEQ